MWKLPRGVTFNFYRNLLESWIIKFCTILSNFPQIIYFTFLEIIHIALHSDYCNWGHLDKAPYITYTGMCRPTGSWFWSSGFITGYPFQRPFLERGIIFRTHEMYGFVSSHLKLFKDRLLLKIWFNALTRKLMYSLHLRTEFKKLAHV